MAQSPARAANMACAASRVITFAATSSGLVDEGEGDREINANCKMPLITAVMPTIRKVARIAWPPSQTLGVASHPILIVAYVDAYKATLDQREAQQPRIGALVARVFTGG